MKRNATNELSRAFGYRAFKLREGLRLRYAPRGGSTPPDQGNVVIEAMHPGGIVVLFDTDTNITRSVSIWTILDDIRCGDMDLAS